MRVKDLQFARYFLLTEVDLDDETAADFLDTEIEIKQIGEPDTTVDRGAKIICTSPSSVTMFIFRILYALLSRKVASDAHRDKMGLALLTMCREYVYHDFQPREPKGPPVILQADKLSIPSFVIREIIEPLIGKAEFPQVLFMPCKYTDVCRVIDGSGELQREYSFRQMPVGPHDFPLILCNQSVHNCPAQFAHLTVKLMESVYGQEKTNKLIRHILLEEGIVEKLILIVKTLRGEADFLVNFLDFLEANAMLSDDERTRSETMQLQSIKADRYLSQFVKTASPQVGGQWTQWSMLMGLIEKQLGPMRGSMWPASERVKPHEDRLRALIVEDAQKKGKTQANFADMLEVARDLYNHNAVEPGQLIEHMLKDVRIWK